MFIPENIFQLFLRCYIIFIIKQIKQYTMSLWPIGSIVPISRKRVNVILYNLIC